MRNPSISCVPLRRTRRRAVLPVDARRCFGFDLITQISGAGGILGEDSSPAWMKMSPSGTSTSCVSLRRTRRRAVLPVDVRLGFGFDLIPGSRQPSGSGGTFRTLYFFLKIQRKRAVPSESSGIRLVHKACGGGPAKSLKTEATKELVLAGLQSKGFGPSSFAICLAAHLVLRLRFCTLCRFAAISGTRRLRRWAPGRTALAEVDLISS
jgi:hypothetical protein